MRGILSTRLPRCTEGEVVVGSLRRSLEESDDEVGSRLWGEMLTEVGEILR